MTIRNVLTICLIATCLPIAAHADDVVLTNDGGTFTSNASQTTLALTGSYLVGISGLAGMGLPNQTVSYPGCGSCLGSVTFTTGTLTSGTLNAPYTGSPAVLATFGAGGTFSVNGPDGMVFTGTFAAGATWSKTAPGTFTFQGTVVNATLTIGGVTYQITNAVTIDLTTNGTGEIDDGGGVVSFVNDQGTTNFMAPTPEPGTLTLMGAGLIGIGIAVRRMVVPSSS